MRVPLATVSILFAGAAALALGAPPAAAWRAFELPDGTPLAWPRGTALRVHVALPLPLDLEAAAVLAAVRGAFAPWLELGTCDPPSLAEVVLANDVVADRHDGIVALRWITSAAVWSQDFGSTELARTGIAFDTDTGAILDTDIAFNASVDLGASAACAADRYDLQAALTHEVGHVLGMDHSTLGAATMDTLVLRGACDKRTLDSDDEAGFCTSYTRPGRPSVPEPAPEAGPEPIPEPIAEPGVEPVRPADASGCDAGQATAASSMCTAVAALVARRRRTTT